jgi:hypothetical protein
MSVPDIINGTYELLGSIAVWSNVYAISKDKGYAGIRVSVMAFFTSWGFWNLYYYPHLGQFVSLLGGVSIAVANVAFITSMIFYGRKK